MDIIRLEGLLTEEEAEKYLRLVFTGSNRTYEEDFLSWRQVEQNILTDTYMAEWIDHIKRQDNRHQQLPPKYYSSYDSSENDWKNGYGSTLDEIKRYLANGNYMTPEQIEQYIQEYLADDFAASTQNFSFSFDILPKAYAASVIHLQGYVKADPSFSDKTDDRISGIEVCGQKKISGNYQTLKTIRAKPACDITDKNGKFVIPSVNIGNSLITLSYLIHTDTTDPRDRNSHVKVINSSKNEYSHNTRDFSNISSSHNLDAYTLPASDPIRGAAWIIDAIETAWQYFDDGPLTIGYLKLE